MFNEWNRQVWLGWRADKAERTARFREEMLKTSLELAKINRGFFRPDTSSYYHPTPEELWGPARYAPYLEWRKRTVTEREQIEEIKRLKLAA